MSESNTIKLPEVVVFAGPNGSGKTTITRMAKIVGEYINADDIKRTTLCSDLEAAIKLHSRQNIKNMTIIIARSLLYREFD